MSTVRAALCFHNRSLVASLGELAEQFAGRIILDFKSPDGVNYILNDADHIHVATRYGCLVGDVPPRVVLIYIAGNHDDVAERIISDWTTITDRHKMRGQLLWSELAGFKTEFKASCDHELQDPANAVRLADLFGDRNPVLEVTEPSAGVTFTESLRNNQRNRQLHSGMVTRRQREAAASRRAAEMDAANQSPIDWLNTDCWYAPGPTGQQVMYFIDQMEPKHLWETICWLVTNYLPLFRMYHGQAGRDSVSLAAKRWLRAQPAFRALVQEAVRRRMTFPSDVFRYLREYMLGRDTVEIAVSAPWEDPRLAHQTEELSAFVDAPLHTPEEIDPTQEFGREFRDIDIDDT